jgi:hypothetical protein
MLVAGLCSRLKIKTILETEARIAQDGERAFFHNLDRPFT